MRPACRRTLFGKLLQLMRCEQGVAFVEFAFSIGLLMLIYFGAVEISRYVIITQKLEKTTSTIANVITQANEQSNPLTVTQVNALFAAADVMMSPYNFSHTGLAIVSDVVCTQAPCDSTGNLTMNWQCYSQQNPAVLSQIGSPGIPVSLAVLPTTNGHTFASSLTAGEEFVISETYYSFTPITGMLPLLNNLPPLYRVFIYVPRYGSLTNALNAQCTSPT